MKKLLAAFFVLGTLNTTAQTLFYYGNDSISVKEFLKAYQKNNTVIGSNVSIAHNAVVHGCKIGDNVLVGMGAIVMDGAIVGSHSVIAAGAIVLPGTVIEPNSIYAGMPAKKIKDISPEMKEVIQRTAKNYPMYASWFNEQ